MTDLALIWNADTFTADLALRNGALVTDDGLRSAVLISLFTDGRAADDDSLPEEGDDRRGWWGDTQASNGGAGPGVDAGSAQDTNRIGSLLWLLHRSKITRPVINQAREAAEAALDWLVRDAVASAVRVAVTASGHTMQIAVEIDRPSGPTRQRFDFVWDASVHSLSLESRGSSDAV